MASNVSQIKKRLDGMMRKSDTSNTNGDFVKENSDNQSKGLLVAELKTGNQMRLGEVDADGKYKCYMNGVYVGRFAKSEFMEFDKWVKEVYKK